MKTLAPPLSRFCLRAIALLLLTASGFVLHADPKSSMATMPALPLVFEQNQGQFPVNYGFVVRHAEGRMGLSAEGITVALPPDQAARPLRLRWQGANPTAVAQPLEPLATRTHYLRPGHAATQDVRNFARVAYRAILPGIDVEYYGNGERLEFDFVLAPGTPLDTLRLKVEGADTLAIDEHGNLRIERNGRHVLQHRPLVYQQTDSGRTELASRYTLLGEREVGFAVEGYDPTQPLVVDPILEFATFFGGNGNVSLFDARVDAAGNIYAMGTSQATVLPGESLPQLRLPGIQPSQTFITKISPDFSSAVFTTYISWAAPVNTTFSVAPAPDGGIYFAYATTAPLQQIPVNRPAITGTSTGTPFHSRSTVVAKLASDGGSLVWHTVAGCDGSLDIPLLAVDSQSRVVLAGNTTCTDFPLSPQAYVSPANTTNNGASALMAISAGGDAVAYSLRLTANFGATATHLAIAPNDEPLLVGHTTSSNFPVTAGAAQAALRGQGDIFLSRFSSDGKQLLASTLYGGTQYDTPMALEIDSSGGATVAMETFSTDLVGTGGSFQPTASGSRTAIVRLHPAMNSVVWATYFHSLFKVFDLAVETTGETWILGSTTSPGAVVTSQRLLAPNSWALAYLGRLNATATILTFGTALPGLNSVSPSMRLLGTPGTAARILGQSYSAQLPPESPNATLTSWPATGDRRGTYLMRLNLADPTVCISTIAPAERTVSWRGGDVEFDVSAPAGCPWMVLPTSAIAPLATILQQQGIGNGKFRVQIARNPTSLNTQRFRFQFLEQEVVVTQEAALCTEPSLSPTSLSFDALGGIRSVTLSFPEGCQWSAQLNAPWFTTNLPAELRGTGSRTFSVSVGSNNFEARSSSLTIAGLTLPIQQAAGACTATVTATPASIPAAGGVTTIQVTPSASTCGWQASATPRVQLGAGSSGTGTASFAATLPANPTNVALTETVHVAGKSINLTQAAGACTVSLLPLATSFGAQTGQLVIQVTATGSACAWFPSTNAGWILIEPEMLTKQGSGSFIANLGTNNTGALRTGTVTILGQVVTITQQAQATVPVRVYTWADGVPFKANGVTYQTPRTLNVPAGSVLSLEASVPEFVTPEHELMAFDRWSVSTGLTASYTVPQTGGDIQLLGRRYMGVRAFITGNSPGDGSRVTLAASTALYKTIGEWQYFERSSPNSQFVGTVTFTAIPGVASRFVRWQTDRQGESTNNPATFNLTWPIPVTARFEPLSGVPAPVTTASATPSSLAIQSTVGRNETRTATTQIQKTGTAEVTFAAPTVACEGSPAIPFTATANALTTPFTLTVTLNTAQISSLTPTQYSNCSARLQPAAGGQQSLVVPITLTVLAAGSGQPLIQFPVDAAGYRASPLAIGSIASVFGEQLAPEIASASSLPLPVELLGTRLILSREGAEVNCPLFFVSPGQINFMIPDEFPVGTATLTLVRNGVRQNSSPVTIADLRPGLFSANASGSGPAAGYYVRVDGNSQQLGNLVECPSGASSCEAVAIQPPATPTGEIYLVLFGTGIRYRTAAPTVDIGGVAATVVYSGPQGQFVGLDQVNIRVPRSLLGSGMREVRLRIGTQQANAVQVRF